MAAPPALLVVGRAIANHLRLLQDTRLLKIDDILKIERGSPLYDEKDRRSIFFAQSWALTHWMLRTQPANVAALSTYLNRVSEGAEPLSLWKQIFGAVDMEQQLEAYVRQPSFQTGVYTLSDKLAKFEALAKRGHPIPAFKPPTGPEARAATQAFQKSEIEKSISYLRKEIGLGVRT